MVYFGQTLAEYAHRWSIFCHFTRVCTKVVYVLPFYKDMYKGGLCLAIVQVKQPWLSIYKAGSFAFYKGNNFSRVGTKVVYIKRRELKVSKPKQISLKNKRLKLQDQSNLPWERSNLSDYFASLDNKTLPNRGLHLTLLHSE